MDRIHEKSEKRNDIVIGSSLITSLDKHPIEGRVQYEMLALREKKLDGQRSQHKGHP